MTRYKAHLIAVKKFNNKEKMIMRDIRDAMEYLVIIMSHHNATENQGTLTITPAKSAPRHNQSPASHFYCYDAKVTPLPQSNAHN